MNINNNNNNNEDNAARKKKLEDIEIAIGEGTPAVKVIDLAKIIFEYDPIEIDLAVAESKQQFGQDMIDQARRINPRAGIYSNNNGYYYNNNKNNNNNNNNNSQSSSSSDESSCASAANKQLLKQKQNALLLKCQQQAAVKFKTFEQKHREPIHPYIRKAGYSDVDKRNFTFKAEGGKLVTVTVDYDKNLDPYKQLNYYGIKPNGALCRACLLVKKKHEFKPYPVCDHCSYCLDCIGKLGIRYCDICFIEKRRKVTIPYSWKCANSIDKDSVARKLK